MIPELRFTYDVGPESAVLRFEHRKEILPVPVLVTITYESGDKEELVIPILERAIERTIPLRGPRPSHRSESRQRSAC